MKTRVVPGTFYIGISFLIVGALFKIQHWPGGLYCSVTGTAIEMVCMIVMAIEIFSSRKASISTKLLWGIPLIILVIITSLAFLGFFTTYLPLLLPFFIIGTIYLRNGRKKFLNVRGRYDHIKFDSIDV